jgi:hypothetical protein
MPSAQQLLERGVPNTLFAGDAAALELRVLHASRGLQFVGAYSRFEWSHPGPAYFYLALPVYQLFDERGPALNVFSLVVNLAMAVGIVLTVGRLFGNVVALMAAALLTVYELVGAPFLLANEWNPILPMLPFTLLTFLAMRLALGSTSTLPALAVLASIVVQTHVAYAPEVLGLCAIAFVARRELPRFTAGALSTPMTGLTKSLTAAGLVCCWALPFYEAATGSPGNLQRVLVFFLPRHLSEHPWHLAATTVLEQMGVMPAAILQSLHVVSAPPRWSLAIALGAVPLAFLAAQLVTAARRNELTLMIPSLIVLIEVAIAVVAVSAIRGPVEFYLVAWVSTLGFIAAIVSAAWMASTLRKTLGVNRAHLVILGGSVLLLWLGLTAPVPRAPVFSPPDVVAEKLAQTVEAFIQANGLEKPVVQISSRETWPSAVAVVLHLYKRGIPVSVAADWLFIVGTPFAEGETGRSQLVFGNTAFGEQAQSNRDLTLVASAGNVVVYLKRIG